MISVDFSEKEILLRRYAHALTPVAVVEEEHVRSASPSHRFSGSKPPASAPLPSAAQR